MNKNKKESSVINIGSSSLLVIFLILCLVTFATLTLSSAVSDYRFSQKLADRKTAYYEASNRAEELLSQIDEAVKQIPDAEALANGESPAAPEASSADLQAAISALSTAEIPITVSESGADSGLSAASASGSALDSASASGTASAARSVEVSFSVPIDSTQTLSIALTVLKPQDADSRCYQITRWQTVSVSDWEADDSIQLLPINPS